jgi:phage FluMu protein Com
MKCKVCNGVGKVEGCGYMMIKCTACEGLGFVEGENAEIVEGLDVSRSTISEEKKKSRSEKQKEAWARRRIREAKAKEKEQAFESASQL